MEDHFVIRLSQCNRCGCNSYEQLASHGYCANCNYSPVFDESAERSIQVPDWAIEALEVFQSHATREKKEPTQPHLQIGQASDAGYRLIESRPA